LRTLHIRSFNQTKDNDKLLAGARYPAHPNHKPIGLTTKPRRGQGEELVEVLEIRKKNKKHSFYKLAKNK